MRSRLLAYLRGLVGRRRAEAESDEELAFHLAQEAAAHEARGLSPAEARRAALRELGGLAQTREAVRGVRTLGLDWLQRDLREAARRLAVRPVATMVAIVSLALAVGAATAVLGIVDALYARDVPVRRPDQLVVFWRTSPDHPDENDTLPLTQFEDLQRRLADVADVFAWRDALLRNIEGDGAQYQGSVNEVSGNFFAVMGVKPLLGRLLDAHDVATINAGASARVAVLDYRTWKTRFGGDPNVVGRTLVVDGTPLTIVGVTPETFSGLNVSYAPDATVPIGFDLPRIPDHATPTSPFTYFVGARLKDGVRQADAAARLDAVWPAVRQNTEPAAASPAQRTRFFATRAHLESLRTGVIGSGTTIRTMFARPLGQLGALGALVLLVAAVNLAALILARTASRRAELALRATLGASRGVLVRSMVVESVLMAGAGAALGGIAAFWIGPALFDRLVGDADIRIKPFILDLRPDGRVLVIATLVAVAIGIVCALLASWRVIARDPSAALQSHTRVVGARSVVVQKSLVAAQVALAMMLVAGAALVGRSLHAVSTRDPGFRIDDVLELRLLAQPSSTGAPDRLAYQRALSDRLSRVPGVQSVAYTLLGPLITVENRRPIVIPRAATTTDAMVMLVGPAFFRTMGMTLLAGRDFAWTDDERASRVAIVSESFARETFGNADAIGQTIDVPDLPFGKELRIVGIVNSASLGDLHLRQPRAVYAALTQGRYGAANVELRTSVDPASVAHAAADAVASLGYQYAYMTTPLTVWKDYTLSKDRLLSTLATFFAGLTLLLAAVGLYAQLSYVVTLRQSEIGVRMAVGAGTRDILVMVLREAAWVVAAGIGVGVPAAILAARVVSNLLFGLTPHDPLTLTLSALGLIAVALVAALVPARRACRVDPVVALR
jgi:predicted permease